MAPYIRLTGETSPLWPVGRTSTSCWDPSCWKGAHPGMGNCDKMEDLAYGTCIYTYVHVCAYAYMYMYIQSSIQMQIHTHIYIYTYLHTHTFIYVWIYMCIHIYIYMCKNPDKVKT